MRKFRVRVAFDASGQAEAPNRRMDLDVLGPNWGPGHVYSLLSPPRRGEVQLVVFAVVAADSSEDACQAVTDHACELAAGWITGSLRRRNIYVARVSRWRRAGRVSGWPSEGDDGLANDR